MAAELLTDLSRATDSNSNPLSGASWYFYATDTLTLQTVYADADLGTPLANPVVADASGLFAPIYFDASLQYRGILKDADGNTIRDIDPINSGLISQFASSTGSSNVGYIASGTGAVARTVQAKARELRTTSDYDTLAHALASGSGTIASPGGGSTSAITTLAQVATATALRMQSGDSIDLGANADGIQLKANARISGGTIDASGVNSYGSAALLVNGTEQPTLDDYVGADDMHLIGPRDDTGVGLYLKATESNNNKVTFSKFRSIYVDGFSSGLKLEATSPSPSTSGNAKYVNGNLFEGHFYGCVRAVDIRCPADVNTGANGNFITSNIQPNGGAANAQHAIYDEGVGNVHRNFTWDWSSGGVASGYESKAIAIPNMGASFGGRHLIETNLNPWTVWDNTGGVRNRSRKIFYGSPYVGFSCFGSAPYTSSFSDPVGNQDDFLVAADKRFTINYQTSADRTTWSAGSAPGTPTNMFRLTTGSVGRSRMTFGAAGWQRIIINLGAATKLQGMWAAFQDVFFPDTVTLRYSADSTATSYDAVSWTTAYIDVPGSMLVQPFIDGDFLAGQVTWLCFEFYKSAAGSVDIERLSAFGVQGQAFVPMYGTSTGVWGPLLSNTITDGIGYATGAGSSVTQLTSKSTGVTLNRVCGKVTMNNAALAAGAKVSFVFTNSAVAATDVVIVNVASGGTANAYRAAVTAVAAGSFTVTVENITAGSLSEAPVISFAVIKAVTA